MQYLAEKPLTHRLKIWSHGSLAHPPDRVRELYGCSLSEALKQAQETAESMSPGECYVEIYDSSNRMIGHLRLREDTDGPRDRD